MDDQKCFITGIWATKSCNFPHTYVLALCNTRTGFCFPDKVLINSILHASHDFKKSRGILLCIVVPPTLKNIR